jgi:hypothetical protein
MFHIIVLFCDRTGEAEKFEYTEFEFEALSFCLYSKRLTHLMLFSVCVSLPPIASSNDVSSTSSFHDVLQGHLDINLLKPTGHVMHQ